MTEQLVVPMVADVVPSHHQPKNPAAVYLTSLGTETSRYTMYQALRTAASLLSPSHTDIFTFPWHQLRFEHTNALRTLLAQRYTPTTANKILTAVRGVLKAARRLRLMNADDYHEAADIPSVRGQTNPAGRYVTRGELAAMLNACNDRTPAGVRDAAIVALLYACGLRRAELVALTMNDYDRETETLRVHGKGNKWRTVPITASAAPALHAWLTLRGDATGPLFCPVRKGGTVILRRMTTQAVYNMLQRRAKMARVKPFSPHDLRRSFVSDLLDAGIEITAVQRLAGHAQPTTTSRYDRRPDTLIRKAVDVLYVPYTGCEIDHKWTAKVQENQVVGC